LCCTCLLFFYSTSHHLHLHSSPTRRSSDLYRIVTMGCKLNQAQSSAVEASLRALGLSRPLDAGAADVVVLNTCTVTGGAGVEHEDRKSTRLNSSHVAISYAVFRFRKKKCGM